jgi:hypothetical protein
VKRIPCRKLGEPDTERAVRQEDDSDCAACEYTSKYFPCEEGDVVFVEVREGKEEPKIRRVETLTSQPRLLACVAVSREDAATEIGAHGRS